MKFGKQLFTSFNKGCWLSDKQKKVFGQFGRIMVHKCSIDMIGRHGRFRALLQRFARWLKRQQLTEPKPWKDDERWWKMGRYGGYHVFFFTRCLTVFDSVWVFDTSCWSDFPQTFSQRFQAISSSLRFGRDIKNVWNWCQLQTVAAGHVRFVSCAKFGRTQKPKRREQPLRTELSLQNRRTKLLYIPKSSCHETVFS